MLLMFLNSYSRGKKNVDQCKENSIVVPSEYSTVREIISSNNYVNNYFILLVNMDRSCSDYIDTIDEVEQIEQGVITGNRCKKVCFFVLEIITFVIQCSKNKNVNINMNGKKEKE